MIETTFSRQIGADLFEAKRIVFHGIRRGRPALIGRPSYRLNGTVIDRRSWFALRRAAEAPAEVAAEQAEQAARNVRHSALITELLGRPE